MKNIARIKKRADFLDISANNYRSAQKSLLVLGRRRSGGSSVSKGKNKVDENTCRIGYTVTKKIGCAVVRNKIRRRFREAVRLTLPSLKLPGYDYVVIARTAAPEASYRDIVSDLRYAFKEIRFLNHKYKKKKDSNLSVADGDGHSIVSDAVFDCGEDGTEEVAPDSSVVPLNLDVYGG